MKTIIQKLPTIYGEAINGSVLGQPNGSIARPPQNVPLSVTLSGSPELIFNYSTVTPAVAYYDWADLIADVNIPSYAYLMVYFYNASNQLVATGRFIEGLIISGQLVNKPADEDALTVKVTAIDSDDNVIVTSDAIAAVAVVSS